MKVLLSAYACEPERGSEPGVGWQWALSIARLGHEVWVLTRENNRPAIELVQPGLELPNLHFLYYDLPAWVRKLKKMGPFVQLYYALWQWGAYYKAREAHQRELFDVVHHLTFGVFRQPSFMGWLGIPFVCGPVGGGEYTPYRLRKGYGFIGHVWDALRDVLNGASWVDPLLKTMFRQAQLIYVKTPQTGAMIPRQYQGKVQTLVEIGVPQRQIQGSPSRHSAEVFNILYIGRFVYWKGMSYYGLRAFSRLLQAVPQARLTMVGAGPQERQWKAMAHKLGIGDRIHWVGWMPKDALVDLYRAHDVFLFPSLHDSSGNVLLEAMAQGLPIVCFDLGGPGMIVDDTCGRVLRSERKNAEELVLEMAEALQSLATDPALREKLSWGSLARARTFSWDQAVNKIYGSNGDLQHLMHTLYSE